MAPSALRQEQVQALFEIEGDAIVEGDIVETADILAGSRRMIARLSVRDHRRPGGNRQGAKARIVKEDNLAIIVGNQVIQCDLCLGGRRREGSRGAGLCLIASPDQIPCQIRQAGVLISRVRVQYLFPINDNAPVLAYFSGSSQDWARITMRTSLW